MVWKISWNSSLWISNVKSCNIICEYIRRKGIKWKEAWHGVLRNRALWKEKKKVFIITERKSQWHIIKAIFLFRIKKMQLDLFILLWVHKIHFSFMNVYSFSFFLKSHQKITNDSLILYFNTNILYFTIFFEKEEISVFQIFRI